MSSANSGFEDLLGFVASHGGDKALRVEEMLGDGYVRLRTAEAERRQAAHDIRCVEDIVIELLRNARDADAHNIFLATGREGDTRHLVMLDDGQGIPPSMYERIFEPRVTSKLESVHIDRWGVHGRGMALYAVSQNTQHAYVADSEPGKGTSIVVACNVTSLPERRDQSRWPTVGTDDEGEPAIVRGPRNIVRTCCEFAFEEQGRCEVYIGSVAEIVATIRVNVRPHLGSSDLIRLRSLEELPILERFRVASDAQELLSVSKRCGLEMSERTAHRILAGQIRPVRSVRSQLVPHTKARGVHAVDLKRERRGLQLTADDSEQFLRLLERDFGYLAERYYLELSGPPRLRLSGDRVTVVFDLASDD